MVGKSKNGKLFDIIEQNKTGESVKSNASEKIIIKTETEVCEDSQVDRVTITDEFVTNFSNMSEEDTRELFELCNDIELMVGESDHAIVKSAPSLMLQVDECIRDISRESTAFNSETKKIVHDIPDEVLNFMTDSSELSNKFADDIVDSFSNSSDDISDMLQFSDSSDESFLVPEWDSSALSLSLNDDDDGLSNKMTDSWNGDIMDLFPTLNSL